MILDKSAKIYVVGHNRLVGSALLRKLKEKGFTSLVLTSHVEFDLTNQPAVPADFF